MQIKLLKKTWDAFGPLLEKWGIEERDYRYQTYTNVDLNSYTSEALVRLRTIFETNLKAYAAKTIIRDINTWLEVSENAQNTAKMKGRTVENATKFLTEYIGLTPRKHLYKMTNDGGLGMLLTYYVEEVNYHPPRKSREGYTIPACATAHLLFERFGTIRRGKITFEAQELVGKNPVQILQDAGYTVETHAVRGDYEFYCDEYTRIRDEIGVQYLATGVADDQDIDGNPQSNDGRWYYSKKSSNVRLDRDGVPSKVVIDVFREDNSDEDENDAHFNTYFWKSVVNETRETKAPEPGEEESDEDEITAEKLSEIEIPIHPYVACFDLTTHTRLKIHVQNLEKYVFNKEIRQSLILPKNHTSILDVLLVEKESAFTDIVRGKSGGVIICCQGLPGTGKTLTSEIYAETKERALYTVQCSQLGMDPETLEKNLMKVFARGRRWGAVVLLDEADVYVRARGEDLNQNAIVGVFLRVLEYYSGILFLTTNRGDLIDDAILSRCTARIEYGIPDFEDQVKIWQVLCKVNGVDLSDDEILYIVENHNEFSGRDIKNILKLCMMIAKDRGCKIDSEMIGEMKKFRPVSQKG